METFYLVDFENVHNEGLENIDLLSEKDHVHIFSTENALNIRMDIVFSKGLDIQGHLVPVRRQSLDMHLVSYLGYLLGVHGKQCAYVIVSGDKDYDNIIMFWKKEGYHVAREHFICENVLQQKKVESQQNRAATQAANSKNGSGIAYAFSGAERSELNQFMQHGLIDIGYTGNDANMICKCVIAHCNDEQMLSGIHNDLRRDFEEYLEVYEDVKTMLAQFASSKGKAEKSTSQIRKFFDQHFGKTMSINEKEEIISILINAQTRQQVNNALQKMYSNGSEVKHILQTIKPFIKDLPGR